MANKVSYYKRQSNILEEKTSHNDGFRLIYYEVCGLKYRKTWYDVSGSLHRIGGAAVQWYNCPSFKQSEVFFIDGIHYDSDEYALKMDELKYD